MGRRASFMSTDVGSFAALLLSYGKSTSLFNGMLAHDLIIRVGLEDHPSLGSQLIQMYGKCGAMQESISVFSYIPQRNVYAFNYIMSQAIHQHQTQQVLHLFRLSLQEAVLPNRVTFVTLLSASGEVKFFTEIHALFARSEFQDDVVVGTALLSMYGRCSRIEDAERVFHALPERNVVSWSSLIALYVNRGCHHIVVYLFQQMLLEGNVLDKVALVSIISALASDRLLEEGKKVNVLAVETGLESDIMVSNAFINMYSQCGSLHLARKLFYRMSQRDVISWTGLIVVCMEQGNSVEALQLFGMMLADGIVPDVVFFMGILSACSKNGTISEGQYIHSFLLDSACASDLNVGAALVNMYGKFGSAEDAKSVFEMFAIPDMFLWNTMLAVYCESGQVEQSLKFLQKMCLGDKSLPDEVSFVTVLNACVDEAALGDGKLIHYLIVNSGFEGNMIVNNALIDLYGKCGSLEDAQRVFDSMMNKTSITWTTIIAVYALHGHGKKALQLFSRMQKEGPAPDEVTFLSILTACKHSGLVLEGCQFFRFMTETYILAPGVEHFACMVDLLGRAGRMSDAEELFNKIPLQPTPETVTALFDCVYRREDSCLDFSANLVQENDGQSQVT